MKQKREENGNNDDYLRDCQRSKDDGKDEANFCKTDNGTGRQIHVWHSGNSLNS